MTLNNRLMAFLKINGKFICQMGCSGAIFDSMLGLYKHFWEAHSADELANWGINWDVLEAEFGTKQWMPV